MVPVYYVPFLFGSWGSADLPGLILSALGQTQSCPCLVTHLPYERARKGQELKPVPSRIGSPKRFKNKHENCFGPCSEALAKPFSGDTMEPCAHSQGPVPLQLQIMQPWPLIPALRRGLGSQQSCEDNDTELLPCLNSKSENITAIGDYSFGSLMGPLRSKEGGGPKVPE